jgi:8-oxo-dGTP pyrophosphatase MutT (NUDIX family)
MGKSRIRSLALGLIEHRGHLFVSRGVDQASGTEFYRFLGGGIDFGETSLAALKREFQEEIQAELTNIQYLGCLENLFTCHGKAGHELIQLFRCDFVEQRFYQLEGTFTVIEGKQRRKALWLPIEHVRSRRFNLVPESCHGFF